MVTVRTVTTAFHKVCLYYRKELRNLFRIIVMNINESAENYLETILQLSKILPVVRSVDIANELGFKKSSVSVAMKNLRLKEYITVTDSGFIYLTDSGRKIAEYVYEKHTFLKDWLCSLGVTEDIAGEDACKMEHIISDQSFDAIKEYVKKHTP